MAQTGYTPISIYYSTTASTAPTAGNLVNGELAINITDGILYYKDNAGVVQKIGTKGGVGTSTNTQVLYNSSGAVVGSANFTYNGTTVTIANDASISGLTVGQGKTSGLLNTAFGYQALNSNLAGVGAIAIGYQALYSNTGNNNIAIGGYYGGNNGALYSNTSGDSNIAVGNGSLAKNTTGTNNNGIGYVSLNSNITGSSNTALGSLALYNNTTASNNTAVGYQAGYSMAAAGDANSTAIGYKALYSANGTTYGVNTAVGANAGYGITTGYSNVCLGDGTLGTVGVTGTFNLAAGSSALNKNTSGTYNVALGASALQNNTTASNNTAVGYQALLSNTTAPNNTAVGYQAGCSNTTGSGTHIGQGAGQNNTVGDGNVNIGKLAGSTNVGGSINTFVGQQAGQNFNSASFAYTGNTCVGFSAGSGLTTGTFNAFFGLNSSTGGVGSAITTGSKNTIIGGYTGNQGGLDIRTASNYIVLSDGDGNPRQIINTYGKVLINQTASIDGSGSTAAQLEVTQTADNDVVFLTNSNASPYGINIKFSAASPNGTGNQFFYCADTTTSRFIVRSNGGIANYSANNVNLSDERTKKDIKDAGNYLDKICAIPVRTFLYKDQTDDQLNLGVIAQEVEAVAPELIDVGGFGETPEDGVPLKAIYQTDLQYALMKAIQELKQEVDSLKAQLNAK